MYSLWWKQDNSWRILIYIYIPTDIHSLCNHCLDFFYETWQIIANTILQCWVFQWCHIRQKHVSEIINLDVYRLWPCFSENISRSFLSVSLTRKYIFTALVISLGQHDGPDPVIFLFILQIFYLAYLGWVRPFRSHIDNIIEISLESVYFIILSLILIETQFDKNMQWQDKFPYILLVLCISNS